MSPARKGTREGIRGAVVALVVLLLLTATTALAEARPTPPPDRQGPAVEHVILFIGDGMQLEHEIATSRYLTGHDTKLSFHHFPYRGAVATWDVTAYNRYAAWFDEDPFDPDEVHPWIGYDPARGGALPYPMQTTGIDDEYFLYYGPSYSKPIATDSASAATALATGYKTDDGNIAWLPGDPPDGELTTILESVRAELGFATGVVSTVPISHATPAGFASHNVYRNNYHAIANEMLLELQPDVVIGAGHPCPTGGPTCSYTYVHADLYTAMSTTLTDDYVFVEREPGVDGGEAVRTAASQAIAQGKKLLGLFGGTGGNFESPVPSDTPGAPSIARGAIEDPLLRDATLAALEVLSATRGGFFLMVEQGDIDWANHGNDYARMIGTTWDLHTAVDAAVEFVSRPGDGMTWANTLLIVTSDHANSYMRLTGDPVLGKGDLPEPDSTPCGAYGQAVCTYVEKGVTYGTKDHTNELVRLYARGATASRFMSYEGAWYPCTSILDNTQVYRTMMSVVGLQTEEPYAVVVEQVGSCPARPAR